MKARRSSSNSFGLIALLLLGVFAIQSTASYEECFALCYYECMQSDIFWKKLCYPKCGAKCIGKSMMKPTNSNLVADQLNMTSRKIYMT
ncbi:hypothetical protein LINGRAHAP2_LOCUS22452 [Linum grandiflorum]